MVLTIVYPIPVEISDRYLIQDRIYYSRLFIGSKNKLVQRNLKDLQLEYEIVTIHVIFAA